MPHSLDHVSPTDSVGAITAHHKASAKDHDITHEKLDCIEDTVDTIEDDVSHLRRMAEHGKSSYKHHKEGEGSMINALMAAGAGGAGIGNSFLGAAGGAVLGSVLGRGFGHHGGGYGGGYGYGGPGCGGCCDKGDYYNALALDRVQGNEFDIQSKLGNIEYEIAQTANATQTALTNYMFQAQLQACQNQGALLAAIKDSQYAAVSATKDSQYAITTNQNQLFIEGLKMELCERNRCNDRDRVDLQITNIQNQNATQLQIEDERNRHRHEEQKFILNSLFNTIASQQQLVQNKSVTIGSGTSGATSANTQNTV